MTLSAQVYELYMQHVPLDIIFRKISKEEMMDLKREIVEDGWNAVRAESTLLSVPAFEEDKQLPPKAYIVVSKLRIIYYIIKQRLRATNSIAMYNLFEQVDNYLIKVNIEDFGTWNPEAWAEVVEDNEVSLDWVEMIQRTESLSELDKQAKRLSDKLDLQRNMTFNKRVLNTAEHQERSAVFNANPETTSPEKLDAYENTQDKINKQLNEMEK